jgi:hypothetical protein
MADTVLIRTGWRIPETLERQIDRAWSRRRAKGDRLSKQAFVAQVLHAGLDALARKPKK